MSINIGGPGVATTLVGQEEATWFNRTGATRALGDVLQLDLAQTEAETTGYVQGGGTSVFENAVLPEAGMLGFGTFGVVIESGSLEDNRALNVATEGIVLAQIAGAAVPGDPLIPEAGADTLAVGAGSGSKVVAIMLETITRAGTAYVWLKGAGGGQGVDAGAGGVPSAIIRETLTALGGAASEQFVVAGLTATDVVALTMRVNTVPVTLVSMDTSVAGRITIVFSADPRAGAEIDLIAIPA